MTYDDRLADDGDISIEAAKSEAADLLASDEHKAKPDAETGEDPRETREDALDDPAHNLPESAPADDPEGDA